MYKYNLAWDMLFKDANDPKESNIKLNGSCWSLNKESGTKIDDFHYIPSFSNLDFDFISPHDILNDWGSNIGRDFENDFCKKEYF